MTSILNKISNGRTLASGLAALALVGSVVGVAEAQKDKIEVVKGIPVASTNNCSQSLGFNYTGVSTVVRVFGTEDKYVLASTPNDKVVGYKCNQASALIKSAEKDGVEIEMKGYSKDGVFWVERVESRGNYVQLK